MEFGICTVRSDHSSSARLSSTNSAPQATAIRRERVHSCDAGPLHACAREGNLDLARNLLKLPGGETTACSARAGAHLGPPHCFFNFGTPKRDTARRATTAHNSPHKRGRGRQNYSSLSLPPQLFCLDPRVLDHDKLLLAWAMQAGCSTLYRRQEIRRCISQ